MATGQASEVDDETPPDMFSFVWVKMEVGDDELVEGVDYQENQDTLDNQSDEEYQVPEPVKRSRRKPTTPMKRKSTRTNHLECEYCDYKTSFKNCLKYHIMNHTNELLSCDLCDYTTKYQTSLQRHILGQHKAKDDPNSQRMRFTCQQCPYTTMFKGNLVAHQRKHSVEKKFKCDQCEFSTAYRHSYIKHSKTHKPKEAVVYECDKCPFITKYEGHISRHLAQIHKEVSEKASKCDFCDFTTNVRWRLNVHKNRSRQENTIKCDFCDFVTDYHCAFKKHKVEHLSLRSKTLHESDICTVNKDYQLSIENSTNEAVDPNTAPQLTDNERKQYILDTECEEIDWRSIEVLERQGEEKPFQCIQCQYQARFKASVQRHFQRHHTSKDNRPYKCVNCDFSTKTKDQISLHNKRSKSNFLLRCKTCDFSTYFKCQNVMHQKIHYPFKCKLCDYMCKQSFDMHRHHSAIHLGEGIQCRYCNYKASRKESLINHEFIHTGIKPFKCGHCDYSAVRRSLLDNHIKRNHRGMSTKPVIIDHKKIESLKKVDERCESKEVECVVTIEREPDCSQESENKSVFECQLKTSENENLFERELKECERVLENASQESMYQMQSEQDVFKSVL